MYVPNPSARARCDKRSIFMQGFSRFGFLNCHCSMNHTGEYPNSYFLTVCFTPKYICIYLTPRLVQDGTQGQFLSGVLTHVTSVISFSQTSFHTKVKEPNLSDWTENKWINALRKGSSAKLNLVPSRIWTRMTVSISTMINCFLS